MHFRVVLVQPFFTFLCCAAELAVLFAERKSVCYLIAVVMIDREDRSDVERCGLCEMDAYFWR